MTSVLKASLLGLAIPFALPLALGAQPAASKAPADLIVTNARVYTADDARPLVEAFAVRDGRVAFVGSQREAAVLKGPNTRVVDAGGRTVIPIRVVA